MICSALCFSINHVLRKKILEKSDVAEMIILTGSIGFFLMLPFFCFINFDVTLRNIFLILVNTGLTIGGAFLLNIAYKDCEISTVSPLLNINPLFVILISYIVLGEVLTLVQFFGVLLILSGGYIVTLSSVKNFFKPFTSMPKKYFLIVLSTLVLWSFCPVLIRVVLVDTDTLTYMFFYTLFMLSILVLFMIIWNKFSDVLSLAKTGWPLLLVTSLFWVASDFLQMAALAIPTTVVSLIMPVKRISNLFTVILGGNLFNEKNLILKSMACAVMLVGLFVIGLNF